MLSLPRGVFALLGSLNAYIPIKEVPVVELHIDIAGLLDPVQKTLEFFASLHDSRVAQYTMYGDMPLSSSPGAMRRVFSSR